MAALNNEIAAREEALNKGKKKKSGSDDDMSEESDWSVYSDEDD